MDSFNEKIKSKVGLLTPSIHNPRYHGHMTSEETTRSTLMRKFQ